MGARGSSERIEQMRILELLGLTRDDVLKIAATFPPPRTGHAVAPDGKCIGDKRDKILALLKAAEMTTSELAAMCGTNNEGVRLILRRLEESGRVVRVEEGKCGVGGSPAKWRMLHE